MVDLSNKFRPHSWQEVVGQQAIISILQRQVAKKSWKNTYLFVGPHGCGKTTVARILASEINNGQGSPIEIDAASNNGVDNIRNLISDAQQCALDCDYKVYIIDEAHQLTRAAWDAALKLIEEPPESAVFIFCTTNFKKIPGTILSRVQTFEFRRVDKDTIANRLEFILNESVQVIYERSALERIAALADGHVRDAIKYLEKCLDSTDNLTLNNVEAILGLVKIESFKNIVDYICKKDLNNCILEFNKIKSYNTDLLQVYDSFINFCIDCAIFMNTKNYNAVSISKDLCKSLIGDYSIYANLVNRLILYRKYSDAYNVESFIKVVLMEMCK
jgi:DNA polymerase-3 subunit gamma/tau